MDGASRIAYPSGAPEIIPSF